MGRCVDCFHLALDAIQNSPDAHVVVTQLGGFGGSTVLKEVISSDEPIYDVSGSVQSHAALHHTQLSVLLLRSFVPYVLPTGLVLVVARKALSIEVLTYDRSWEFLRKTIVVPQVSGVELKEPEWLPQIGFITLDAAHNMVALLLHVAANQVKAVAQHLHLIGNANANANANLADSAPTSVLVWIDPSTGAVMESRLLPTSRCAASRMSSTLALVAARSDGLLAVAHAARHDERTLEAYVQLLQFKSPIETTFNLQLLSGDMRTRCGLLGSNLALAGLLFIANDTLAMWGTHAGFAAAPVPTNFVALADLAQHADAAVDAFGMRVASLSGTPFVRLREDALDSCLSSLQAPYADSTLQTRVSALPQLPTPNSPPMAYDIAVPCSFHPILTPAASPASDGPLVADGPLPVDASDPAGSGSGASASTDSDSAGLEADEPRAAGPTAAVAAEHQAQEQAEAAVALESEDGPVALPAFNVPLIIGAFAQACNATTTWVCGTLNVSANASAADSRGGSSGSGSGNANANASLVCTQWCMRGVYARSQNEPLPPVSGNGSAYDTGRCSSGLCDEHPGEGAGRGVVQSQPQPQPASGPSGGSVVQPPAPLSASSCEHVADGYDPDDPLDLGHLFNLSDVPRWLLGVLTVAAVGVLVLLAYSLSVAVFSCQRRARASALRRGSVPALPASVSTASLAAPADASAPGAAPAPAPAPPRAPAPAPAGAREPLLAHAGAADLGATAAPASASASCPRAHRSPAAAATAFPCPCSCPPSDALPALASGARDECSCGRDAAAAAKEPCRRHAHAHQHLHQHLLPDNHLLTTAPPLPPPPAPAHTHAHAHAHVPRPPSACSSARQPPPPPPPPPPPHSHAHGHVPADSPPPLPPVLLTSECGSTPVPLPARLPLLLDDDRAELHHLRELVERATTADDGGRSGSASLASSLK